ncbi:MAG: FecR domain-containing protein [Nitrospiraceae bacterium]|nr:FecR domain-containing protein [Nitrospiraceae bacterium]
MKVRTFVMVAIMILLAPSYALPADSGWMRISLLQGDVQIKTADSGDWGPASLNGPVMEGDQIWVPQGGRVELQLNMGTYIRLDQNSALQILATDKDSSQFYLSQGHAYVYFDAPRGSVIQIDTPDASSRAFEPAVFRLDMSDEYQYTDVAVYKGYVETENELGRTRVNAGEMVSLGQDTNGEVAPMGPPDEWERWNKKRNDRILRRGVSSRYLPPELRAYSYDFDTDGRWVEVPDYGYCWTPTVTVGVNWAPYRQGRWIWSGGEYIWVSFDPWGWVPYHYGRWAFVARIGWCWVPPAAGDVYWGPGYVGWVGTGDYVGWVPLAPGEIYYGRGYYGRHSVNITNITQVNITHVYKNVYVNNGPTIVERRTFASASPKIMRMQQNVIQRQIFARNNLSAGTPSIRPTRESYFASAKRIPAAKLPPQPVRKLDLKHLKQSRPFVKAPDRSVLKPGTRPGSLPLQTIRTPRTPGQGKPTIQRIKPQERGVPGIQRGPAPRGEVKPQERRVIEPQRGVQPQREVKPQEKRVIQPQRSVQPQREVKPQERRVIEPQRGVQPQREVKPQEKRVIQPQRSVQPQREVKPQERRVIEPQRGAQPQKQVKPQEKRPVSPQKEGQKELKKEQKNEEQQR